VTNQGRTTLLGAVLLAFLAPVPGSLSAQAMDADPPRWTVSLVAGTTSSGPAGALEQAMIAAGFDEPDETLGGYAAGRTYPYSATGWGQIGLPFVLELRYRPLPWAYAGLAGGLTPIGETVGYQEPIHFVVEYRVAVVAAVAGIGVRLDLPGEPRFRLGVGPARYRVARTPERGVVDLFTTTTDTTGVLFEAGTEARIIGNAALALTVQYRRVGSLTVGPVTLPTLTGPIDFPAVEVGFSHWLTALGLSIEI